MSPLQQFDLWLIGWYEKVAWYCVWHSKHDERRWNCFALAHIANHAQAICFALGISTRLVCSDSFIWWFTPILLLPMLAGVVMAWRFFHRSLLIMEWLTSLTPDMPNSRKMFWKYRTIGQFLQLIFWGVLFPLMIPSHDYYISNVFLWLFLIAETSVEYWKTCDPLPPNWRPKQKEPVGAIPDPS